LINAAVSHELRNPLSSIIGQIASMKYLLQSFSKLINEMKSERKYKGVINRMEQIYNGLK